MDNTTCINGCDSPIVNQARHLCERCYRLVLVEIRQAKRVAISEKACRKCGETKPVNGGFYRNSRSADGWATVCKACRDTANTAKRIARRERGPLDVESKQCITCERVLPTESFGLNNNHIDGWASSCRECLARLSPDAYAQWQFERRRDAALLDMGMKHCRVCGEDKPLDGFARRPDSKDGRQYKCRECGAISDKACRNLEKERERRKGNREYYRDAARKRRARKLNPDGIIETVKRFVVAERDGWICQHCDDPIDPNAPFKLLDGRNNPEYLNIDHWVPLSHGGDHTYENCYASHAICNWRKNAKVLTEPPPLLRTA